MPGESIALKPFGWASINLAHPQLSGCRAWWPMWEGGGRFVHDVVGGAPHLGTFEATTGTPVWTPGRDGWVVGFDGTDDVIETPFADALENFTCTAWFLARSVKHYGRIFDKNFSSGFWLGRDASNANQWGGGVKEGAPPYGRFVTLTDGVWHHIASVRRGTTHTIYGDGGAVSASGVVTDAAMDNDSSRFGDNHTFDTPFDGLISDVRVYNRALSLAEIQDIMLNPWASVVGDDSTDLFEVLGDPAGGFAGSLSTLFIGA